MNELLAKLVDITYELFGVLLPGLIASAFLLLWWFAAEPLQVALFGSSDFRIGPLNLWNWLSSSSNGGLSSFLPLLVAWYLLGQVLLSASRHSIGDAQSVDNPGRRVFRALTFRISRPPDPYDPALKPLYHAVAAKFNVPGVELQWVQFYPVVKSHLAEHLSKSLVTLYQNKYTLHRSITMASAVLFWLSILTCLSSGVGIVCGVAAHWVLLGGS